MAVDTIYDGLIGYWTFDEVSGDALDVSGYGHQGVLSNGARDTGKVGSGFRPSTSAGKVTAPGPNFLSAAQAKTFSVSVWVNLDKAFSAMWGTTHTLISKENPGVSGYSMAVRSGDTVTFRAYDLASSVYAVTYVEAATTGWVHYVGVFEGDTGYVRLYRNGTQVAQTLISGTLFRNYLDWTIGEAIEGVVDEVAVWRRAITPTEVTAVYGYANTSGINIPLAPNKLSTLADENYTAQTDTLGEVALGDYAEPLESSYIPYSGGSGYGTLLAPFDYTEGGTGIARMPLPYVDPLPEMAVAIGIGSLPYVTLSAEAGPTDVGYVSYWFEFDVGSPVYVRIGEVRYTNLYGARFALDQDFLVPVGMNLSGKPCRVVVQSEYETTVRWVSPWTTYTSPYLDNSAKVAPPPLRPILPGPPNPPPTGVPVPGVYQPRILDFSRR